MSMRQANGEHRQNLEGLGKGTVKRRRSGRPAVESGRCAERPRDSPRFDTWRIDISPLCPALTTMSGGQAVLRWSHLSLKWLQRSIASNGGLGVNIRMFTGSAPDPIRQMSVIGDRLITNGVLMETTACLFLQ
jgi:hypothetical protein